MRSLLKVYLVYTLSLFLASRIFAGIVFENGWQSILFAGAGMALVSLLVKPIINILLLPLNLITFGLFRWVSSTIALYLVTLAVPGFKIVGFQFAGLSSRWLDIPNFSVSGFLAIVVFSFAISLIASIIHWLIKG